MDGVVIALPPFSCAKKNLIKSGKKTKAIKTAPFNYFYINNLKRTKVDIKPLVSNRLKKKEQGSFRAVNLSSYIYRCRSRQGINGVDTLLTIYFLEA